MSETPQCPRCYLGIAQAGLYICPEHSAPTPPVPAPLPTSADATLALNVATLKAVEAATRKATLEEVRNAFEGRDAQPFGYWLTQQLRTGGDDAQA